MRDHADRILEEGLAENTIVITGLQAMTAEQMIVTWISTIVQITAGVISPFDG